MLSRLGGALSVVHFSAKCNEAECEVSRARQAEDVCILQNLVVEHGGTIIQELSRCSEF